MKFRFALVFLTLCLVMASACSTKPLVPLEYAPVVSVEGGCPGTIGLVEFTDARDKEAIGVKEVRDVSFEAGSSPVTWITDALDKELTRNGCKVTRYASEAEASGDVVVVGSLKELWLEEKTVSQYQVDMNVAMALMEPGITSLSQDFIASRDVVGPPSYNRPANILKNTLQGMMPGMVDKIIAAARGE